MAGGAAALEGQCGSGGYRGCRASPWGPNVPTGTKHPAHSVCTQAPGRREANGRVLGYRVTLSPRRRGRDPPTVCNTTRTQCNFSAPVGTARVYLSVYNAAGESAATEVVLLERKGEGSTNLSVRTLRVPLWPLTAPQLHELSDWVLLPRPSLHVTGGSRLLVPMQVSPWLGSVLCQGVSAASGCAGSPPQPHQPPTSWSGSGCPWSLAAAAPAGRWSVMGPPPQPSSVVKGAAGGPCMAWGRRVAPWGSQGLSPTPPLLSVADGIEPFQRYNISVFPLYLDAVGAPVHTTAYSKQKGTCAPSSTRGAPGSPPAPASLCLSKGRASPFRGCAGELLAPLRRSLPPREWDTPHCASPHLFPTPRQRFCTAPGHLSCFVPAPSFAPKLHLKSISKSDAELCWEPLPVEMQNGFITGYTIFWADSTAEVSSESCLLGGDISRVHVPIRQGRGGCVPYGTPCQQRPKGPCR